MDLLIIDDLTIIVYFLFFVFVIHFIILTVIVFKISSYLKKLVNFKQEQMLKRLEEFKDVSSSSVSS